MDLRPYQHAMLSAVEEAFFDKGQNRQLIQASTGLGKTVVFAHLPRAQRIAAWLATYPKHERGMLVIAHREELIQQSVEKIHAANPDLLVAIEQADQYAGWNADVVVASIQTLTARKCARLKRLLARQRFRLVVADECHRAAAPSWRTALAHLGFLPMVDASDEEDAEAVSFSDIAVMEAGLKAWEAKAPKDQLLCGFTATPGRADSIGLGCVFQTISYQYGIKPAIDDGWLCPVVSWAVETRISLEDVRISRGDFNQKDLAEAVNDERRNDLAVSAWRQYALNRQTLAFTVDVAHAHALAATFVKDGIPAVAVSGDTAREERRDVLNAFRRGDLRVICNCQVFTEGTDLPMASCILHAKPTKSSTLYIQMSGRALRPYLGKDHAVLIDLVDVSRRHSLQTAGVLYGLPPSLMLKGHDLRQAAQRLDDLQAKCPGFTVQSDRRMTLDELEAMAVRVDLWSVRDMSDYAVGLEMQWIRTGEASFRLQYPWADGTEILTVEPDLLNRFSVAVSERIPVPNRPSRVTPARMMAQGVTTAGEALRLAEAFMTQERTSVIRLKDREAPWRRKRASEKQLALLKKFRAPIKPTLTAGEASDMLDTYFSRRGR